MRHISSTVYLVGDIRDDLLALELTYRTPVQIYLVAYYKVGRWGKGCREEVLTSLVILEMLCK